MPKINQEEYEVLKNLDDKWEWIARDEDGELYVYTTTPHKGSVYWSNEDLMFVGIDDNLFQFIQWEDEEPYNIAKLIEEYEREELRIITVKPHSFDVSILEYGTRFSGSEEAEVKKDIEWLKEEVNEIKKLISDAWGAAIIAGNQHFEIKNSSEMQIVKRISDLINQLDEPEVTLDKAFEKVAELYSMTKEEVWRQLESFENRTGVLSQEWLDKHLFSLGDEYLWKEAVPVDDLQNLLVPKQEEITEEQAWEKISEYYPVKQAGLKSAFEHFYYGGFMTDVVAKKPVIPRFVADWIEERKSIADHWFEALEDLAFDEHSGFLSDEGLEVHEWVIGNPDIYVDAYRLGYEVEEEQKLTARDVIEKHIELLKHQEEAVNLKPYYDLLERVKNE